MHLTKDQEDILLRCTAAIMCKDQSGNLNTGTAFWFQSKAGHKYLITNKHVIKNKKSVIIYCSIFDDPFIRKEASPIEITLEKNALFLEDDDLAAIRVTNLLDNFAFKGKIDCRFVESNLVKTDFEDCSLLEDVVMPGYPAATFDTVHNYPLIRTGRTCSNLRSQSPDRNVFWTSIQVSPGDSGAPVFLMNTNKLQLIGVNRAHKCIPNRVKRLDATFLPMYIDEDIGISTCVGSFLLKQFLNALDALVI